LIHRRAKRIRRRKDLIEESLARRRIPAVREMEVERGAAGVHGSEQIHPAPGDPNIGLPTRQDVPVRFNSRRTRRFSSGA